uniref:Large ribosomal subunit protein uL29m n=1 Tax=Ornithodoros turicata TaxID=34597 RepID=A0A2R5LML9_9ACAR
MHNLQRSFGLCFSAVRGRTVGHLLSSATSATRCLSTSPTYNLRTSFVHRDLMEFFEPKENWGAQEVKSGKSWSKEELRIKSNSDLHKLWYVLLKEYNMLLTMEHAAEEAVELFPSPERIDKVQDSMANLEAVVRERNRAYYLLETGETGEQPWELRENDYGLVREYARQEHVMPRKANPNGYFLLFRDKDMKDFLRKYREQEAREEKRRVTRDRNRVVQLLKRFPDVDKSLLKEKYPDVDIDKLVKKLEEHIRPAIYAP